MSKREQFWKFRAAADKKSADLLLYGPISRDTWWEDEISPKKFEEALEGLGDIETLTVYIFSEGGDIFAAHAIYSMLRRHKATVNVYIDGLAASAASLVAMAGKTITMPQNAMMMIHSPSTFGCGNAEKLRKVAADLDNIRESMVPVYAERSGKTDKEVRAIMDKETWYTAKQAVEAGFADVVDKAKYVAAGVQGSILTINGRQVDISMFRNFPVAQLDDTPVRGVVNVEGRSEKMDEKEFKALQAELTSAQGKLTTKEGEFVAVKAQAEALVGERDALVKERDTLKSALGELSAKLKGMEASAQAEKWFSELGLTLNAADKGTLMSTLALYASRETGQKEFDTLKLTLNLAKPGIVNPAQVQSSATDAELDKLAASVIGRAMGRR